MFQVLYSGEVTDTNAASFCLPTPRRGEEEFVEDTLARLGSHIKAAEQAMIAAKTEALRPFELTVAQYAALMSLYYVPEQSSAQLARVAAVTAQTMGQTLDRLEAKGLVTRKPSKVHRKVLVVSLTPAGEALVLRADEAPRAIEQRLGGAFTDAERAQLRDLLRRATASLRGESVGAEDPQAPGQ
ncbi:MarR family transcriptional regulator [Corynebacterium testudinoris]|uniref:Transcriptional regulator n=1 Tax=Corynebacterium testudinoris TaxID=136857 RepID=A0A0G3HE85_9CORY|nr:MarR family transcriptional regulator [Corynebacterium testudinoris]AKK09477.1 transcriptional regulator [Corynebacterium testudinoris]MBX8996660.1 MarR family transcriptional regulator [Corynebacterium testudinoris]